MLAVADRLHMWPGDLETKVHSRWELLEFLAGIELRERYQKDVDTQREELQQQTADGISNLKLMP